MLLRVAAEIERVVSWKEWYLEDIVGRNFLKKRRRFSSLRRDLDKLQGK
jgi:hypothetical protein